jgi:hypothetical protein
MGKPLGVTASAIVAILGSTIFMAFGALLVVAMFLETPKSPPVSVPFGLAVAAMYIIVASVGIWTSIGLFRLRPWARTLSSE